jgi:hypothetical protein
VRKADAGAPVEQAETAEPPAAAPDEPAARPEA